MPLTAYLPDSILSHGAAFEAHALLTQDGRITALIPQNDVPVKAEKVLLAGLTLAPGLVDAQVNGGGGALFNDDPGHLARIVAAHRASGTAMLMATHISDDLKKIPQAVEAVRDYRKKDSGVGLHLEGPFLNPEKKGIHPASAMQSENVDVLLQLDAQGLDRFIVTLAPEIVNDVTIKNLAGKGAVVMAGHSMADAGRLAEAKQAGLRGVTHLYNAMGPALADAALADDAIYCGIICDAQHVSIERMQRAVKAKPPGRLFFVSDAMPPAGEASPRDFDLLGEKIFVRNGRCENAEGKLAGCALTLFECMRIAVQQNNIPLPLALNMASLYPAQFLGIDADYGSLQVGRRAAVIAFDKNLKLEKVFNP